MKVWFIGIKGAVATTMLVGVLAIKRGLSASNGIMSEEKRFSRLNLARLEDLQFGGHDIRSVALYDAAYQNVCDNSTFDTMQLAELKEEIDSIPVEMRHCQQLWGCNILPLRQPGTNPQRGGKPGITRNSRVRWKRPLRRG